MPNQTTAPPKYVKDYVMHVEVCVSCKKGSLLLLVKVKQMSDIKPSRSRHMLTLENAWKILVPQV